MLYIVIQDFFSASKSFFHFFNIFHMNKTNRKTKINHFIFKYFIIFQLVEIKIQNVLKKKKYFCGKKNIFLKFFLYK